MSAQNKGAGRSGFFPQRPRFRDYLMMINMVLFLVTGSLLLYRAFFRGAPALAYLMGAGLLFIGGHRFYLLYKAIRGGR